MNTAVKSVVVENKKATVILENGETIFADYVIPACDIHTTFKLLGGKYSDKQIEMRDNNPQDYILYTNALFSFAVNHNMKGLPQNISFATDIELCGRQLKAFGYSCYNHEPDFAPKGKSIMQVNIFTNYDFWKSLSKEQYAKTKIESSQKIIAFIESKLPELKDRIRLLDVATPLTYERYCGSYKGAYMAWGATANSKDLMHAGKIKGIKNLFMAGQWLLPPGGLPMAITGKWAVQRIMKNEKMNWRQV